MGLYDRLSEVLDLTEIDEFDEDDSDDFDDFDEDDSDDFDDFDGDDCKNDLDSILQELESIIQDDIIEMIEDNKEETEDIDRYYVKFQLNKYGDLIEYDYEIYYSENPNHNEELDEDDLDDESDEDDLDDEDLVDEVESSYKKISVFTVPKTMIYTDVKDLCSELDDVLEDVLETTKEVLFDQTGWATF